MIANLIFHEESMFQVAMDIPLWLWHSSEYTFILDIPVDLVRNRRQGTMWVLLIDWWWQGTLSRLPQATMFTMMYLVELGQVGLNSIETFGSRPAVRANDTDVRRRPPAWFAWTGK